MSKFPEAVSWTSPHLSEGHESLTVVDRVIVVVMKHHGQKQVAEERVCLAYASIPQSVIRGSLSRNSNREAGAGAEATEECCLLACSSLFAPTAFL